MLESMSIVCSILSSTTHLFLKDHQGQWEEEEIKTGPSEVFFNGGSSDMEKYIFF